MARLKDYYKSEVASKLMEKFNYKSPMQIPITLSRPATPPS